MTNEEILKNLQNQKIDIYSALERFLYNKEMYIKFIKEFTADASFDKLEENLNHKKWEQAFEFAHTLKGITGNLGMTILFEDFSKMCAYYRKQEYTEMQRIYIETKSEYTDICNLINTF